MTIGIVSQIHAMKKLKYSHKFGKQNEHEQRIR